jgi:methylmalonyl-CoA/ethylmalonyl-CoA epimerase
MKLQSIDHICFAVKNLAEARKVYEDHLGLAPALEYTSKKEKIHVVRYWVGEVAVEMLEPTQPDSDVGRFLEKRGEGFFLISYRVENVEEALQELKDKGVDTIDKAPRELMGNRYAFIHKAKELAGILTEVLDGDFNMEKEPE